MRATDADLRAALTPELLQKAIDHADYTTRQAPDETYMHRWRQAVCASLVAALTARPEAAPFCNATHLETGAVCELPRGHTQNHRGQFNNGIAQWLAVAAPPEGTPPQANQALRQLYDAFGVFDGYDDCEDCGDKSEAGNDEPCRFHGSQKLWEALVAAERALGPCECGHATDDHFKEDTTRCRVCECHGFRLPAVAALFPHDGSRT